MKVSNMPGELFQEAQNMPSSPPNNATARLLESSNTQNAIVGRIDPSPWFAQTNILDEITSKTSQTLQTYFVFLPNTSDSSMSKEMEAMAKNAVIRMMHATTVIYKDLVASCNAIIEECDLDNLESRSLAFTRLRDTLAPFESVIIAVFRGLVGSRKSDPIIVSFLLSDVLLNLRGVDRQLKFDVIRDLTSSATPSIRFAAFSALDDLGSSAAKQLMARCYPAEGNRMVKSLMDASLRSE